MVYSLVVFYNFLLSPPFNLVFVFLLTLWALPLATLTYSQILLEGFPTHRAYHSTESLLYLLTPSLPSLLLISFF